MILVVDDSPHALFAATRMLRRAGHRVVTAATVADAELLWDTGRPDLVLLDVNLPDGNGIEVSHRWKKDPDRATVPIVLRSAVSVSAAEQTLGLDSGADGYLIDPVEPEVLVATVSSHLRIRDLLAAVAHSSRNAEDLVGYSIALARAESTDEMVALVLAEAGRSPLVSEVHLRWLRAHGRRSQRHGAPAGADSVLAALADTRIGSAEFLAQLPPGVGEAPAGQRSWAVLPFDDVEVSGTIVLAFTEDRVPDEEHRRFLQTFAGITGLSLGRAAALELYSSIAGTLQRALVPPPVLLPGLRVERRIVVAEGVTIAGGDWFDAYPLPSGAQVVVCGDVVGHGPEAAGTSAVFRHTLWTLLLTGTPVAAAVTAVNRLVRDHPSRPQGTLLVVELDTGGRVRVYSAGHVPPVLVRPGDVALVPVTPVPPLGMVDEGSDPVPTAVDLTPGDVLLLITDGVVEHSGADHDIDTGYEQLCEALRAAGARTPTQVLDVVEALVGPATPADDALFAVIALES